MEIRDYCKTIIRRFRYRSNNILNYLVTSGMNFDEVNLVDYAHVAYDVLFLLPIFTIVHVYKYRHKK